jgi:hypothetical protein
MWKKAKILFIDKWKNNWVIKGVEIRYYYDGSNVILEEESGNLKARNIYGINPISREDTSNNIYYYLYNGHADVVGLVDSSLSIKNSYDYDIYGKKITAAEDGIKNPIRYAG